MRKLLLIAVLLGTLSVPATRRPSLATCIASVALFFSLTGAGMAATGYRITSIWQIAPSVRHALRGERGPQGVPGPAGQTGPQGAAGAPAPQPTLAYVSSNPTVALEPGQETSVRAYCPVGSQLVSGGYMQPADPTDIVVVQSTADQVSHDNWVVIVRNVASTPISAQIIATAVCANGS